MEAWRQEILTEARSWLGTRFCHQGRRKRSATAPGGVDCLGLLVGVAAALSLHSRHGGLLSAWDTTAYSKSPDGGALHASLARHLYALPPHGAQPGDIGLFRFEGRPQHLAFFSAYPLGGCGLIHAYAPSKRVVEHGCDAQWRSRLVAAFSLQAEGAGIKSL